MVLRVDSVVDHNGGTRWAPTISWGRARGSEHIPPVLRGSVHDEYPL